eukprot:COSAG02_NODE_8365_length_2597_cov_1.100480_1_plen_62_part_10
MHSNFEFASDAQTHATQDVVRAYGRDTCPYRLRRSTQVVTESTAVLFDTETAGDIIASRKKA